jgi:hypothetical protein
MSRPWLAPPPDKDKPIESGYRVHAEVMMGDRDPWGVKLL